MHDYKDILGVITIVIAVISYSDYFLNIFKGCTIPRTISWFIWGVLNSIAFTVQYSAHGGSGAWITGFTAMICFVIAALSYMKCEEHFTLYDWVPFLGAVITVTFWLFTNDPIAAIFLTIGTYILGFIPTIHNAYLHPKDETAMTFGLNALKFFIAIFALDVYSLQTILYPIALVLLNIVLVSVILIRRKKLAK